MNIIIINLIWSRNIAFSILNGLHKVKGKGVPNRPGVAQRVPGGLGSQIFMTFGT